MSDVILTPPQPEQAADLEVAAFNAGPKCGSCRHWRQQPTQKIDMAKMEAAMQANQVPLSERRKFREQAILQNSGKAIGAERMGQCRRELLTVPNAQPGGQVAPVSYYPSNIPAAWPCCGHFAAMEAT